LIAHLLEAGWPVYPVNPRTVDRRRSASGAKTDTIDAYLLAKTGRADLADLHRLTPDSEKVSELKELTRDQDALIRMRTGLVNQPHLQADAMTMRTRARLMLVLVSQLLPLLEQIAQYDKEITTLFLTHEDHEIFASLPRAGQHLAPRLLAEIGDDRSRYHDAS